MPPPAVTPRVAIATKVTQALQDTGRLRRHAVSPATFRVYTAGVRRFAGYCRDRALTASSASDVDLAMEGFITWTFDDDPSRGAKARMVHAVMGYELFVPAHRKLLVGSRLALRGWDRLVPKQSPPPVSYAIMNGVCMEHERRGDYVFNIAFRLQFNCYLRANELLHLAVSDISLPGDPRLSH